MTIQVKKYLETSVQLNTCEEAMRKLMYSMSAARMFEDEHDMIYLIITQAHENELMYVLFPFEKRGQIYGYNQTNKVEPYPNRFTEALFGICKILYLESVKISRFILVYF
jgi:hypothetical protein